MKLKYEDKDNIVKLRDLRPGECFRFRPGPDVYMVTDYQGECHLYINIETGETTFLSDIHYKEVIALQVEATVKRHSDCFSSRLVYPVFRPITLYPNSTLS